MTTTAPAPAPALRLRDRVLRVAEALTTPLLPEDYLDLVVPLRSGAALRGRIVEVRPETADAATIVIRPGRDWRPHVPGQYVRLGVDVEGVRRWRAYSLTSVLDGGDLISVTVKAIPDGVVSHHLVHRARPGQLVHLDQAIGDFTLPATPPAKALFVTGGSGITPVMGMLRNHLQELSDVVLVHSSPTAADVVFDAELRAMHDAGHLRLVVRHTDTEGMLAPTDLDGLVPDLAEREAWVCGPTGLLDAVEELYAERGWSERLHTERFRPTLAATGEGGTVTFGLTGTTVDADGTTPILDAGEEAGVLMPSGCRMGICYGCVLPLREGSVRDLRTGEVTTASEGDGVAVQTCINAAAGPCHLDI